MLVPALLSLLHILIPVYWLGGDLGAFYSAGFLIDPERTVPERMLALTMLNNIDMAPRTTLILALPTGVLLGWEKGWLALPWVAVLGLWLAFLAWLAIAWSLHLKHGAAAGLRRVDLTIRWILLAALVAAGLLGLTHLIAVPLFIAVKLLLLAGAIALGLLVRRLLVPLFAPIVDMRRTGASTPEGDRAIAGVIARTRPAVMAIWVLVLAASLLGLAKPL
jgi:hypothetical protein